MCQATLNDNKVHDTDPIAPGDQYDATTPLKASVHCHQQILATAGELSSNSGPMDGLWMMGVTGDSACLYTDEAKADPSKKEECELLQNQQKLMDAMEARWGDCTLICDGEVCHRGPDSGWHEPDVGDIGSHRILDDTSSGGLPNYEVCDYSLDTNGDGEVGDGEDDLFEAIGGMFGAILSKDALYFMVTDASTRDLIKYAECDETVSGRR